MPRRFRYRRHRRSTPNAGVLLLAAGALAGIAVGVVVAQRMGGWSGITERVRRRRDGGGGEGGEGLYSDSTYGRDEFEQEGEYDDLEGTQAVSRPRYQAKDDSLEERVLEAFRNDPILGERAVDIGALGERIVELTGWVHTDRESQHAVTVTRGVPGVDTVVNRLAVRTDEDQYSDSARRYASGDPALTEARWERQDVGTGRRRQGNSSELDRHADPRSQLEDRWMSVNEAKRAAADDIEGIAERRAGMHKGPATGGRADGSPVAPTGVPKGDHVAEPESPETQAVLRESTGRTTARPEDSQGA